MRRETKGWEETLPPDVSPRDVDAVRAAFPGHCRGFVMRGQIIEEPPRRGQCLVRPILNVRAQSRPFRKLRASSGAERLRPTFLSTVQKGAASLRPYIGGFLNASHP